MPKAAAAALVSSGITDSSLTYHLQNAKEHGVTKNEIAAILTHVAFYAGWPKAWAAFNQAKEVWKEEAPAEATEMEKYQKSLFFPIGEPNDAYARYFSGRSFLAPVSASQIGIHNVTFEPGCQNNWHIHHAKSGGGKHWHGAAEDSWFSHLAIEVPGEETSTEWLEASK